MRPSSVFLFSSLAIRAASLFSGASNYPVATGGCPLALSALDAAANRLSLRKMRSELLIKVASLQNYRSRVVTAELFSEVKNEKWMKVRAEWSKTKLAQRRRSPCRAISRETSCWTTREEDRKSHAWQTCKQMKERFILEVNLGNNRSQWPDVWYSTLGWGIGLLKVLCPNKPRSRYWQYLGPTS